MRCFIFIPIGKTEEANDLAVLLAEGDQEQRRTFGTIRLSSTGEEPATHTACEIVLSDEKAKEARAAVESVGGLFFDDCSLHGSAEDEKMKMILSFEEAEKAAGIFRIFPDDEE